MKLVKGVSPLISSVLLIAFVLLVSMALMDWSNVLGKEKSEEVAKKGEKSTKCMFASFMIIKSLFEYSFSPDNCYINLTVKNTGKQPLYNFTFSVITGKGASMKSYAFVPQNQKTKENPLKPGEFWEFTLIPESEKPLENEKISEIHVSAVCEDEFTISNTLVLED